MKLNIKRSLFFLIIFGFGNVNSDSFESILKKSALDNGFKHYEELYDGTDKELNKVGDILFKSKNLSLNGNISCQSCHLVEFSSADGIPNAVGVFGEGKGKERLKGDYLEIIPRNTLPFWGRGGKGFDTFFWDGKVDFSNNQKISQFGDNRPSNDPLIVSVHLPALEIGEMLTEDKTVSNHKLESIEYANEFYKKIVTNLKKKEQSVSRQLSNILGIQIDDLTYMEYARSIAAFIRNEFKIKKTKFHSFIYENKKLTDDELKGGLIFYGKGKCSTCHSGPYFSDFEFHSYPFKQIGFGFNGFGIDYGRFNVTFNPEDLYKFRTPPLYNVTKTKPYSHSGSVNSLYEIIDSHSDPLNYINPKDMDKIDRVEIYRRLLKSSDNINLTAILSKKEINQIIAFLKTLEFQ